MDSILYSLEQSPGLVASNIMIVLLVFLMMRRSLISPRSIHSPYRFFVILLLFTFVLFSFWGSDWFHYRDAFSGLRLGYAGHIEDIYVWISQHLAYDYLSFRFVIWGIALILLLLTLKRLSINYNLALLFLGSVWILWFSYARFSLALSLVFWGIALIYKPWKIKAVSYIVGLSAIVLSVFFHKTALFVVAITLITMVFKNMNSKGRIYLLILLTPVIISGFRFFIKQYMAIDFDDVEDEFLIARGQDYLLRGSSKIGIGTRIQRTLEIVPYYLLTFQCFRIQSSPRYKRLPPDISFFIALLFLMVFASSLFLLNIDLNTSVIYIRFMRFCCVPAIVLMSFFWENSTFRRLNRWTYLIALMGTAYTMLYSLYIVIK